MAATSESRKRSRTKEKGQQHQTPPLSAGDRWKGPPGVQKHGFRLAVAGMGPMHGYGTVASYTA